MEVTARGQRLAILAVLAFLCLGLVLITQSVFGAPSQPGRVTSGTPVWVWNGGGTLYDVDFSGDSGWLTGWYGAIGHSTDGGVQWSGQYAETNEASFFGVSASGAMHVWAVADTGYGGAIYHSADSGAHWSQQANSSNWSFQQGDIFFVNNTSGWAVGADWSSFQGLILHTTDGGATWSQQNSGTINTLYGVSAVDPLTAWAVGQGGTVLHTTDGGAHWTTQAISTTEDLMAVYAISTNDAIVVGTNYAGNPQATIFFTTDGGNTWAKAISTGSNNTLYGVSCTDIFHCWAVGAGATILSTADGGLNWTAQANPVPHGYILYGVDMYSATQGVVVGEYGALLRTADGGTTWSAWSPITTLKDVDFPAAGIGWIAGRDGTVAQTTNGGQSWTFHSPSTSEHFEAVDFINATDGFLVSYGGDLYRTTDGGTTWTAGSLSPSPVDLFSVDAISATRAIAGGTKYVYNTTSGITWTAQIDSFNYYYGVEMVNPTTAWAVGETSGGYGVIYATTNGITWTQQYQHLNPIGFQDVSFVSATEGWAVGEGASPHQSLIRHTTDGGNTWQDQSIAGFYTDLYGVTFLDSNEGWAVGETATILHTTNGGTTWSQEPATSRSILYAVASDGSDLFAVGANGTILKRILYVPVTPTNTSTETPTPTETSTPTNTPTPTDTPTPTNTPTDTPTPTATATVPTCSDPYEPNEDFAGAYLLDPLDPAGYDAYICHSADEDWFGVNVNIGEVITVSLGSLPKNYDLELYDPDAALVSGSHNAGTTDEAIAFQASNWSGEYRVRVFSPLGEYAETQTYHLFIEVGSAAPAPLVVNTTDDLDDGTCNAAHCSLREAINAVNSTDAWEVQFAIPLTDTGFNGFTWIITPTASLPTITQRIRLDASTQTVNIGDTNPEGPEVVLDGGLASTGNGLALVGTSSATIQGLVIHNWAGAGIYARGTTQTQIYGCYLGTDRTGTVAVPNQDGVVIEGGHSAHIGGTAAEQGNLISGNTRYGIHLDGTAYAQVVANIIGMDRTGTSALGNEESGVFLNHGSEWNTIGGDRATAGNLISGNDGDGILIDNTPTLEGYNRIWGNRIGVNTDATASVGNLRAGIKVVQSNHNQIGDADPARGNIIGGNHDAGIYFMNASMNTVIGNWIGAEPSGRYNLGNGVIGISIHSHSQYNIIGPDNVIAHNAYNGIVLVDETVIRNTITRNSITDHGGKGINTGWARANEGITPPIITLQDVNHIEGIACANCRVELFGDPADEGVDFEGVVTATATGEWTFFGPLSWGAANTHATATDSRGNTSEFSSCYDVYEGNDDFDHAIGIPLATPIESYICYPDTDTDFYSITVDPRSTLSITLDMPDSYMLTLYDSSHHMVAENRDGRPYASISYTSFEGGTYFIKVSGLLANANAEEPYTLTARAAPASNLMVNAWVDEGWLGAPAVYKIIPDDDGPADGVWVEVVLEVTSLFDEIFPVYVDLTIPGDVFGAPDEVVRRYCLYCTEEAIPWTAEGGGRYQAELLLSTHPVTEGSYGQAVFRFFVQASDLPGPVSVDATGVARYTPSGAVIDSAPVPRIHFTTAIGAIVITNRHHLYQNYDPEEVAELLGTITQRSIGLEDGEMWSAIYYVDDYSPEALAWDYRTYDLATPNLAHDAIDRLVEDWVEDTGLHPFLLIVGDDDVVPMGRREDLCDGDDTESAYGDYSDPIWPGGGPVSRVINADQYLTDSWYADTNHTGWGEGELELAVGRLVGDSAADLLSLFQNGLRGPRNSPWFHRAVLASWDGYDLHFSAAHYASVMIHVEDFGYSVDHSLVDNDDWRKADLLEALENDFQIFIGGNHGNPWGIFVPPDKDDVYSNVFSQAISVTAPINRPFFIFGGCQVGFTLVRSGLIDDINHQGASGFLAGAGITWKFIEGSENFTEEINNRFARRVFHGGGRDVGGALLSAKASYTNEGSWSCRDRKAVMQVNLYAVPWLTIRPPGWDPYSVLSAAQELPHRPRISAAAGGYAVHYTVDASNYVITPTVPGFDFVEIPGFQQDASLGPSLPQKVVSFTLPLSATITGIQVGNNLTSDLGVLNIPTYIPGVDVYPGGRDAAWVATPPEAGLVPTQTVAYSLRRVGNYLLAYFFVTPVQYDAPTGQTTLYRHIAITVNYTTTLPLALSDFTLNDTAFTAGQAIQARAQLDNVTPQTTTVTTTLTLFNPLGRLVASQTGGPYDIAGGSRSLIVPSIPAPSGEGFFVLRFQAWWNGVLIAQVERSVQVLPVAVSDLQGPDLLIAGAPATFTITITNYTTATLVITPTLTIRTAEGVPVTLTVTSPQTVPAEATLPVTLRWNSAGALSGLYQAVVQVDFDKFASRLAARRFMIAYQVFLPLVFR